MKRFVVAKDPQIKFGLKRRTLLSTGLLMVAIIIILSLTAAFSLNRAYEQIISSTRNGFDNNIKTAVETVISALEANRQLALDGGISESEAMEIAKKIVRDTRYSSGPGYVDDGYFWADMADGLCIVHYNEANEGAMRIDAQDKEGTYYIQNFIKLGDEGGGYSDFYFGKPGDEDGSYKKRGYTKKFEPYGWYISSGNYYEDTDKLIGEVYAQRQTTYIALIAVSVVIALAGLFLLSRSLDNIVKPIRSVVHRIQLLALGDTTAESGSAAERKDELGVLERSMRELSAAMLDQAAVIEHIANGNLSVWYEPRSENDSVGNNLQRMLISNNDVFREITSASDRVASVANRVASDAQGLAHGSAEQLSGIDMLSEAISTVLDQTKENVDNAQDALDNVREVGRLMDDSTGNMDRMQEAMTGISDASANISKVIKVIDDIAFQTNILALNAAVEAARAGQHGKGFAVVADEVRNLASKSAEAAKETADLISDSVKRVGEGNVIAKKTGESIRAAASYSERTHEMIDRINAASHLQKDAITEINEGIERITQVVQANSETSEKSAELSREMNDQTAILANTVSRFKLSDAAPGAQASLHALPARKG
jgi:methyl-accepting chemotaxis protein